MPLKKKTPVDGQLDAMGRMVFQETREQRQAREKEAQQNRRESEERRQKEQESVAVGGGGGGGRKMRLALPGGRGRLVILLSTLNKKSYPIWESTDSIMKQMLLMKYLQ